jgi:branched-chain amino acid transport system permease protein
MFKNPTNNLGNIKKKAFLLKTSFFKQLEKLFTFWAMNEKKVGIAFLAVAIVLPLIVNNRYIVTVMTSCALFTVLCLALNLLNGYMGVFSLGHAAFYGIGAYTAAIMATKLGFNFLSTFIFAGIVAGIFGILLGLPSLRVKGKYLAIVTLGFCEIARIIELNWMGLTRGPMGIPNIPTFTLFGIKLSSPINKYYICLALLLITIYIVSAIIDSRTGRAVIAIKNDELAASAMGINVFKYRVLIFAISAALTGAAGAYYAHFMSFIDPKAFGFEQSIQVVGMIILGGMGSIQGSILGAIVLTTVPEILRGIGEYRLIIYGLVITVMVIVKPKGLFGEVNLKHIRQRKIFNSTAKGVAEIGRNDLEN